MSERYSESFRVVVHEGRSVALIAPAHDGFWWACDIHDDSPAILVNPADCDDPVLVVNGHRKHFKMTLES